MDKYAVAIFEDGEFSCVVGPYDSLEDATNDAPSQLEHIDQTFEIVTMCPPGNT